MRPGKPIDMSKSTAGEKLSPPLGILTTSGTPATSPSYSTVSARSMRSSSRHAVPSPHALQSPLLPATSGMARSPERMASVSDASWVVSSSVLPSAETPVARRR